jgi:hypothetical protein
VYPPRPEERGPRCLRTRPDRPGVEILAPTIGVLSTRSLPSPQFDPGICESFRSTGSWDRSAGFELRRTAHRAKGADAKGGIRSRHSLESTARRTGERREGWEAGKASHWRDLNPRPADYESAALPTELQWLDGSDDRIRPISVPESERVKSHPVLRSRRAPGLRSPRSRTRIGPSSPRYRAREVVPWSGSGGRSPPAR